MHFQNSILASFALAATANAHMKMSSPKPYGADSLNNSPLAADGSDFPCKLRGADTFNGDSTSMAIGSTQPLEFVGSAVHGGGSCQISITYDMPPSKSSTWKVIHSIEGGCPAKGVVGNLASDPTAADPSTYSFTIPSSVKTGQATLAWTWFNKIGNREMYMNCAGVTITGGSSKRDEDLAVRAADFDSLPDMFVANVGNGCATLETTDVLFPNPGDSVEQLGLATKAALSSPTGAGCAAAVGGAGASSAPAVATSASAVATSATAVATSAPDAASPTDSPGVFATVPLPSASATTAADPPAVPSTTVAAPTPAGTTPATVPASSPASGSSSGVQTGACSPEGQWNCIGGTSFQRCASGVWSVEMALAAGTSCTPGISTDITMVAPARRNIRFSNDHIRRHIRRSS